MINIDLLDELITERKKEISRVDDNFLREFPVEFYINELRSYSKFAGPLYLSPKLKMAFKKIGLKYDFHIFSSYHKLALSLLISDSAKKLEYMNMPESIRNLYRAWFERAANDFSRQSDDYYSQRNGLFLIDLAICSLRAIPIGGAWFVTLGRTAGRFHFFHLLSRVLRMALRKISEKSYREDLKIHKAIKEAASYIQVILFKTRGPKPFYIIHSIGRYLPRYTPREMELAYTRIVELLELNPKIKGIYRCSWFLDPALDSISPELAYLREVPVQNGARLFPIGIDRSLVNTAIVLSSLRKRLYLEGKYLPTWYAYIWPRIDLLEWAHRKSITD